MHLIESVCESVGVPFGPEVHHVFETHIARDASIVIGGPGASPRVDCGLLWASFWVAPGGKISVADPKSSGEDPTRAEPYDSRYVTGSGDVKEYQTYLQYLAIAGLPLAPVEWLGRQSTLWHMPGLGDGTVDHVMDHYTSIFLLRRLALPKEETVDLWKKILREYRRILKPGGTLLLQSDMRKARVPGVIESHEDMMGSMREAGFEASHLRTRDIVHIPLPRDVCRYLKVTSDGGNPWRTTHDMSVITSSPYYSSPDLYIARKV